ncbi:Protein of unknown function [Rhizobiales bacterium GAS191]|nr:Protein of unknown function [Rhizobiales bacterium GAS191]
MALDTATRFADPDAAYRLIVEAHRGLDETQSRKLDAALILVLANQIGDLAILQEALALARAAIGPSRPEAAP